MEKRHLDRRLAQMRAEGTEFRCGVTAGEDVSAADLRATYDAIMLAGGATAARELPVPGRELDGMHQAMEYLPLANRVTEGDLAASPITAAGKNVVIIGGGDTGADCLGTALRQGAASVTQLEIMPRPPRSRPDNQPWPTYPMIYRVSSAHEEGGERVYSVSTQAFLGSAGVAGGPACVRSVWSMSSWLAAGSSRSRAPNVNSLASWCCSRWGSPGPSAARCSPGSASSSMRGQRGEGRRVRDLGPGRLRRW